MKFTSITILFAGISILAMVYIINRIKRNTMGIRSAVIWLLLWLCIGFFSIFPSLLNSAMRLAQMEDRMFFILTTAAFILFALVFNLSSRIDSQQRNISRLIQELAILTSKTDQIELPAEHDENLDSTKSSQ